MAKKKKKKAAAKKASIKRKLADRRSKAPAAGDDAIKPPTLPAEPTFARPPSFFGLPRFDDPRRTPEVDVLLCGLPFDGGTGARPGARFGPAAVRDASASMGSYSAALGIDVYEELQVADGGDVPTTPHDMEKALRAVAARAEAIARSGIVGGFVGGDQTVTLGALRGIRKAKLRGMGLVHFDARSDTLGPARGRDLHNQSVLRRAVEERLIHPDGVIQVGIRGPHVSEQELQFSLSLGFEIVKVDDVKWDLYSAVSQIRKIARKRSIYVSVDVSALDPSAAPGTSSPSPGGMNTWELQQILRALVGAQIVGFDVVEVAPHYDSAGITAQAAASVLHEMLAVVADTRRSARPAPSRPKHRGRRLSP